MPRDYLVLARAAVVRAQTRAKARIVGVQDVNEAAGDAAQAKLQELEEDLAANIGGAERTLRVLSTVREFCLERTGHEPFTYFRVDFRDKEAQAVEYASLADLMDVRLVHLIDGSLSDGQKAGRRYEVFMLDLSQYSGKRLRHGTRVLELVGDHFVSRTTRVKDSSPRVGDTARNLNAILRGGPIFDLALLRDA